MKSKTAKYAPIKAFELHCPHCGEAIENPRNGSLYYLSGELEPGERIGCQSCGESVKAPKRAA